VSPGRRHLDEQIAFYRADAPEYDQSLSTRDQLEAVRQSLAAMGPFQDVLELACGTGLWTREWAMIGRTVTAIDASPEMIEINRRRVAHRRVLYKEADLFTWDPEREYDLLFTAFWRRTSARPHVGLPREDPARGALRRDRLHRGSM
jgi:ubiquinone/menaquinone biosynthesis C-methylase UbiE